MKREKIKIKQNKNKNKIKIRGNNTFFIYYNDIKSI
jgi:hypothetical protein